MMPDLINQLSVDEGVPAEPELQTVANCYKGTDLQETRNYSELKLIFLKIVEEVRKKWIRRCIHIRCSLVEYQDVELQMSFVAKLNS